MPGLLTLWLCHQALALLLGMQQLPGASRLQCPLPGMDQASSVLHSAYRLDWALWWLAVRCLMRLQAWMHRECCRTSRQRRRLSICRRSVVPHCYEACDGGGDCFSHTHTALYHQSQAAASAGNHGALAVFQGPASHVVIPRGNATEEWRLAVDGKITLDDRQPNEHWGRAIGVDGDYVYCLGGARGAELSSVTQLLWTGRSLRPVTRVVQPYFGLVAAEWMALRGEDADIALQGGTADWARLAVRDGMIFVAQGLGWSVKQLYASEVCVWLLVVVIVVADL